MKKFLGILIVLAVAIIVVVIMMKPSKEEIVKDKQEQEIVKEEAESTANDAFDALNSDDFDDDAIDPDTLSLGK
jgi:Tfp pilus assembly protein PilO